MFDCRALKNLTRHESGGSVAPPWQHALPKFSLVSTPLENTLERQCKSTCKRRLQPRSLSSPHHWAALIMASNSGQELPFSGNFGTLRSRFSAR